MTKEEFMETANKRYDLPKALNDSLDFMIMRRNS